MNKVLLFLFLFIYCTLAQTTVSDLNVSTTTAFPNPCLNGGFCIRNETSEGCEYCDCQTGFIGDLCETVLTKINGFLLYTIVPAATPNIDANTFENAISAALNVNYTLEVEAPLFNDSEISILFSFYVKRPPSWTNYTDAEGFHQPLQTRLSQQPFIDAAFNPSDDVSFHSLDIDVDECASNWSDCDPDKSFCVDRNPGYLCLCEPGYEGDGVVCSPFKCTLDAAPEAPSLATRTFYDSNGTEITEPGPILPFGTSIQYTCFKYYELVDINENPIGLQSIACQNGGWGQVEESSCATELGFKIALGMAIVSSIIIVVIVGAYFTYWCVKAEKKKKRNNQAQQSSYDNLDFGDV